MADAVNPLPPAILANDKKDPRLGSSGGLEFFLRRDKMLPSFCTGTHTERDKWESK
jgi:hypothetical protein